MPVTKTAMLDLVRAMGVLALLFLNFAHLPPAAAAGLQPTLTASLDTSFCGDLPADPAAHAPCHACRIGAGADLPPAPAAFDRPARTPLVTTYDAATRAIIRRVLLTAASPRGPPLPAV